MRVNSITTARNGHRSALAFEQYVRGKRTIVEGTVLFLETADHLEAVMSQARSGDVIFAPAGAARRRDSGVVEYQGDLCEPGDKVMLGEGCTFELRDYVAAPFISIVGPTVLRQRSAEGIAAFFSDADTARDSGVFVDQLLSGAVLLDSFASFIGTDSAGGFLDRVHVTAAGEYRDGPDGLLLGVVGDEWSAIESRAIHGAGRGRAFARIVDRGMLEADLDDRPWLARYIAAIDLLRGWDGVPTRPAISGFGGHLVRALDELPALPGVVSASAPYLLTGDGDEWVLVDPLSRRRTRLGVDTARAAECLIATGNESAAVALLAAELGRGTSNVASLVHEVQIRFAAVGLDLTTSGREGL